jgi:hypothetical protein
LVNLIRGTNCGFVAVAPAVDPLADNLNITSRCFGFKDTAPVGANSITHIGYWKDAGAAGSFYVGLYSHDAGNNRPGNLLASSAVQADNAAGWYTIAVPWNITAGDTYWVAISSTTSTGNFSDTGTGISKRKDQATLPNPFGVPDYDGDTWLTAIFAVWSASGGTVSKNVSAVMSSMSCGNCH